MTFTTLARLLITTAIFTGRVSAKKQQPFIEASNYVNFSYLTTMLVIMTVIMVAIMALIIFIDTAVEDYFPYLKVNFCNRTRTSTSELKAAGNSIPNVNSNTKRVASANTGRKRHAKGQTSRK